VSGLTLWNRATSQIEGDIALKDSLPINLAKPAAVKKGKIGEVFRRLHAMMIHVSHLVDRLSHYQKGVGFHWKETNSR
jgi:hypothetical protein